MVIRTLEQAIANAERCRSEIPKLIQPGVEAYDLVLLADALAEAKRDTERLRNELPEFLVEWQKATGKLLRTRKGEEDVVIPAAQIRRAIDAAMAEAKEGR